MEVLVFKTTVSTPENVKMLKPLLDSSAGRGKWNFALDDCDKNPQNPIFPNVCPNRCPDADGERF
jgi:hypothetical protein